MENERTVSLEQALNDLRVNLGLDPLEDIIQKAEYHGQLSAILNDFNSLAQKPELPSHLQALLTVTRQDIYQALQGKASSTIQDNLIKTANALIEQANQLQSKVSQIQAEEAKYINILQQSQTNLKEASKALYDEIQKGIALGDKSETVQQEYLEVLYRVGYAQGAIDLSSNLAKQSQEILTKIITGRVEEQKAREKAVVNQIIGTITTVVAIAGAILTGGATLGLYSATSSLATLGTNLTLASSALSLSVRGSL